MTTGSFCEGIPFYKDTDFVNFTAIGEGAFGTVYKGYHEELGQVAVKAFKESDRNCRSTDQYTKEIDILIKHAGQPNIVHLYGILWDGMDDTEYLGYVMEYLPGGSLHDVIHSRNSYDLQQVCGWVQQTGLGLQYLHKEGIIHRDIKPANLLISGDQLKVADFGIARNVAKSITAGVGTWYYMAPEVLRTSHYGFPVDIYSLAITIWEIFQRTMPYEELGKNMSDYDKVNTIVSGYRPTLDPVRMGEENSTFVERCWQSEPSDRPPINEIIQYFGDQSAQLAPGICLIPPQEICEEDPSQQMITNPPASILPQTAAFYTPVERDLIPTIIVLGGGQASNNNFVFNRDTFEWMWLPLEVPGFITAAVYLNEELYVLRLFGTLQKLDNKYNNWLPLAEMNAGRTGACCLEMDGFIWVLEGAWGKDVFNSMERYNPEKNTWTTMPSLKYARQAAAATACGGKIIICGGYGEKEKRLQSVELFDPISLLWIELVEMPTPFAHHSLVCYDEKKLILFGGEIGLYYSTVFELEPFNENDHWKKLPPRRRGYQCCGSVLDKEIFAIGEYVEIFNGNVWRTGPRLPSLPYRDQHSLSTVMIPQYLADGIQRRWTKQRERESGVVL